MKILSTREAFRGEIVIWVVFLLLSVISLTEVFSAGSTLAYKSGGYMSTLYKQAFFILCAAGAAWCVHNIPVKLLLFIPSIGWLFSLILLIVTAVTGTDINGASRWLSIGGFTVQPSELAKIAIVAVAAIALARAQGSDARLKRAFYWILGLNSILIILIAKDNLSTAALIMVVLLMMFFIGRVPVLFLLKWIGGGIIVAAMAIVALFAIYSDQSSSGGDPDSFGRVDTWVNRIKSFNTPRPVDPLEYDTDKDGQKAHANIAIATSRITGVGVGNSVERDFLSQAYSDFIYAIILEELGIVGGIIVIFLYAVLLVRAGNIAYRSPTYYPAFLVMGLALMMCTQALVNMLVAVGIMPVTGQPLPLISRGGSSLIFTGVCFGIILSVSRYSRKTAETPEEKAEVAAALADENVNEAEFLKDTGVV